MGSNLRNIIWNPNYLKKIYYFIAQTNYLVFNSLAVTVRYGFVIHSYKLRIEY